MKRTISLTLAVMALFLAACGPADSQIPAPGSENVEMPNPWITCDTQSEAEKATALEIRVPDEIEGCPEKCYRAMSGDHPVLKILYQNEDSGEIRVRKASGTEDISGDYHTYADQMTAEVQDAAVTLKGNDGQFFLAVWTGDGYTYSITASDPLPSDTMTALVGTIQ